jgi:hypothetical protein
MANERRVGAEELIVMGTGALISVAPSRVAFTNRARDPAEEPAVNSTELPLEALRWPREGSVSVHA